MMVGDKSKIEWTDATWNPIVGCSVVSPGCTNCYAMKMAGRLQKMNRTGGSGSNYINHYDGTTQETKGGAVWTGKVACAPEKILLQPLSWKKPRCIFVNSMGDLFHESIPDEWIDLVFAVMALCPQHTFQVLTKRAERMRDYVARADVRHPGYRERAVGIDVAYAYRSSDRCAWPLPNVWLGVSAEDQPRYDERKEHLRNTPAAVRFFSIEPLIGPIEADYLGNWVIVGGESGSNARPMHPQWVRDLRDQCKAAGVPFFFKQWGEWAPQVGAVDGWTIDDNPEISRFDHRDWEGDHWGDPYRPMWCDERDDDTVSRVGKRAAGRLLDGIEHNRFPEMRS
jgi:protein gp37